MLFIGDSRMRKLAFTMCAKNDNKPTMRYQKFDAIRSPPYYYFFTNNYKTMSLMGKRTTVKYSVLESNGLETRLLAQNPHFRYKAL